VGLVPPLPGVARKTIVEPSHTLSPYSETILTVAAEALVRVYVMVLEVACVVETHAELDVITTVTALLLARVVLV
jgi:hypothetical protein